VLQIREEVSFTNGRIIVRGKLVTRGKSEAGRLCPLLQAKHPIAIIEAKDNNRSVGDGIQQALGYATTLNIPFVFSSNGDGFLFHDRTGTSPEKEATSPWINSHRPLNCGENYRAWKGLTPDEEKIVLQDYFDDGSGKAPRYYQCNAVNAAIEAIAKGQDRILLVIATGTGKTKTCPENGCCSSTVCTFALRPSNPRRISVMPAAIHIFVPGVDRSLAQTLQGSISALTDSAPRSTLIMALPGNSM